MPSSLTQPGFGRYKREAAAAVAYVLLLLLVAFIAPSFFRSSNIHDLLMNNAAVLILAVGMTLVILAAQIDISIGSQFAICTVAAGVLAKAGVPILLLLPCVVVIGALLGTVGGAFVAWLRMPSIVVTLALMVAWRDVLRWATEGAWVQDLPKNFQWFGLSQTVGQLLLLAIALMVFLAIGWALRNLAAGRAVYAVGCDAEAARLAGIDPQRVIFGAFVLMGALSGLAAMLNAVRFSIVPSNAGIGLELKAIAAVVVGGTAITGGRGTLLGTLIGVALLGTVGTALTFMGINPFWEKAIQGAIILAALVSDVALGRLNQHGRLTSARADAS
jgi:ribose/xylose/arabinose/galactoside ABC-type transport system permease subunit